MTEDIRPAPAGLAGALDRNRLPLALGILVPLEILPAVGLYMAATEESGVGLLTAFVFLAVCALPSIGVWRLAKWAPALGIYLGWTAIALLAVLGASRGFTSAHIAVAALNLLVIVALTLIAPRAERPAQRKDDGYAHALKENIEAIVVAFIMALVIRCFCIEVFKIPTSSMEPTLMGDHDTGPGDRIMVTKPYYLLNDIERFDVVVFKFPLNQVKNFIKRIVGMSGEEIFIERGNIWARRAGTNDPFRVQRKPLRTQRSLWIRTNIRTGLESGKAKFGEVWQADGSEQAYTVENGALRTLQHGRSRDIRFIRRTAINDAPAQDGAIDVGEIGVTFDLEIHDKDGTFFFENPTEFGRFRLELKTAGAGTLRLDPPKGGGNSIDLPRLEAQRTHRIELLIFDGIATVSIDGRKEPEEIVYLDKHDKDFPTAVTAMISFGAAGTTFSMSGLDIGRDVYYRGARSGRFDGLNNAQKIGADHYVMMGDNVNSSHDSRMWRKVSFKLKDGTVLSCESQDLVDLPSAKAAWAKKHGRDREPDWYMAADHLGYERGIYQEDLLEPHPTYDDFYEVPRDYIVGKALWIWFPQGRWFRLIR